MGSFSVSCGISGLPIHDGDKIGIVPIRRNPERALTSGSYSYPDSAYQQFCGPIYGEYDDYGSITNIVRGSHTAFLENFFRCTIEEFLAMLNDGLKHPYTSDVWNVYNGSTFPFKSYDSNVPSEMVKVGFKEIETGKYEFGGWLVSLETELVTENAHPDYPRYTHSVNIVNADSRDKTQTVNNFSFTHIQQFLEKFMELTSLYPGYKEEDYKVIAQLMGMTSMFILEDVYARMDNFKREAVDSFRQSDLAALTNFILAVEVLSDTDAFKVLDARSDLRQNPVYRFIERQSCFPLDKLSSLTDNGGGILDAIALYDIMHSVNRIFAPTFCGHQEGDIDANRHLALISLDIIAKKEERFL